jgi:hypothetical protein
MPYYERLQEEQRTQRRTIADALEVLRQNAGFKGSDRAEIWIGPLQLPSGEVASLVSTFFESPDYDKTFIVALPTSAEFRAKRQGHSDEETFDIFQLEEATFDDSGNVRLRDGTHVRAVEVIPTLLPYDVTELDWRIVHHTVAQIHAEQECYRYPINFLRRRDALDCSALPTLQGKIPPLKVIKDYIENQEPALKRLSQQQISDTLRKFGMRLPKQRPRRS